MPLYNYVNKKTGEEREVFLSISDMKPEIEIDGEVYEKKPEFASNFILKGTGWAGKGKVNDLGSPIKQTAHGIKIDKSKIEE